MPPPLQIQIEEIAIKEIQDAFEWYEMQSKGLGNKFRIALQDSFDQIQKSPNGFKKYRFHRQCPMKDFPYVILYEISGDTLFVDAVFHTKRDPKYKKR
ncbi:MAG: type II toxin-antitoxin system RelE/ParE family toxin [Crocinitomicaceae bacterium]|nr:type II toxin-antitoxin system RelE/ParE family toxin [Crocinitomicaceae bacterium]